MPKYQTLIQKLQSLKNSDFTPTEIAFLKDALETIQFLEIFFQERRIKENEKNF